MIQRLASIPPRWRRWIKGVSPILMVVALGVDGAIAYRWSQSLAIVPPWSVLGVLGTGALVAHGFEGIIAGSMARSRGQHPLRYGIYTFWMGTVALVELLALEPTD
ncbi:hypothetical protein [Lyngbya confervoides]|uniref:Uncharacterized protein n=1 Tax=Lyngbya confervoides BDU141951 TaxID=1574623 RepID=A0ABD4TB70_9CYAN|nr:hypothetical protein [Lyngbya confervoides]MCM1985399.1 hypothetical protein [Lyngbya confervoides BDU141951]